MTDNTQPVGDGEETGYVLGVTIAKDALGEITTEEEIKQEIVMEEEITTEEEVKPETTTEEEVKPEIATMEIKQEIVTQQEAKEDMTMQQEDMTMQQAMEEEPKVQVIQDALEQPQAESTLLKIDPLQEPSEQPLQQPLQQLTQEEPAPTSIEQHAHAHEFNEQQLPEVVNETPHQLEEDQPSETKQHTEDDPMQTGHEETKEQEETVGTPVAALPSIDESNKGVYQLTQYDVVLDDTTGVIKANKLLTDLIAVHHQLNNRNEGLSQHLVRVMKFGLSVQAPDARSSPQGNFVRRGTDGSISVISDAEAVDYVQKCIDYEFTKPIQEMFEGLGDDLEATDQENDGKKGGKRLHDLFTPGAHDLKLVHRQNGTIHRDLALDFSKSKGNTRFFMLVDQQVANDAPTFTDARVKTALTALRRFNDSSTFPKIFVESDRKWARVTKIEAAEYVVHCVAERAQEFAPLAGPPQPTTLVATVPMTNSVLQSLIPDVGTAADISNFLDFSKPSNAPIDDPTEYDVLFGRGGMTNNHPGNRRFRDIISLHRPDYVRAIKIEKPNVARRIVAAIRGGTPPGRFLKRNSKDLKWYDVGNRHATEKTSQALREKTQAEKKFPSENNIKKRLLDQAIYEARKTRARLSKEQETRPISNGCLDPNTFQLLVPPQYMQMAGLSATYSVSSCSPKENESVDDKPNDNEENTEIHEEKASTDVSESALPEGEKAVEAGIIDSDGNIIVTENDILCGRGGLTNHHKGNKRFRDIVTLHRADYVRAPKVHKPAVARMIVKAIRTGDPPGRFLKKDEKLGKWFDIGDKKAAEKASQALREKTPEERSRLRSEAAHVLPVSMFQNPMFNLQSAPSQAAVAAAVAAAKVSAAAAAKRHAQETEATTKAMMDDVEMEVKKSINENIEKEKAEEEKGTGPPAHMEIDADIVDEVVAASPAEEAAVMAEESTSV